MKETSFVSKEKEIAANEVHSLEDFRHYIAQEQKQESADTDLRDINPEEVSERDFEMWTKIRSWEDGDVSIEKMFAEVNEYGLGATPCERYLRGCANRVIGYRQLEEMDARRR